MEEEPDNDLYSLDSTLSRCKSNQVAFGDERYLVGRQVWVACARIDENCWSTIDSIYWLSLVSVVLVTEKSDPASG